MTKNDMCAKQGLSSGWASAQSDQSSMSTLTNLDPELPTERTAKALIRLGGCRAHMSLCMFCHAAAQLISWPFNIKIK